MSLILKGKRILVVEDEEINWFLIRDILQSHQAILTWAEIGQKAVDLIRQGEFFDLILMDINLPVMDGIETTKQIKALHESIPIIAQTAFALDTELTQCYKAGCVGHVCKPFTIRELIDIVTQVLEDNE